MNLFTLKGKYIQIKKFCFITTTQTSTNIWGLYSGLVRSAHCYQRLKTVCALHTPSDHFLMLVRDDNNGLFSTFIIIIKSPNLYITINYT